jgi:HSP20 family protein
MEITKKGPSAAGRPIRRGIDQFFEEFLPSWIDREELFSIRWRPRMDVSETASEYRARVELPGVAKEDIKVGIEDRELTVSGERREAKKEEGENFLRVERSYGGFFRSLPLPKTVLVDGVTAEFADGVLTIHLPKAEESKPRRVDVK